MDLPVVGYLIIAVFALCWLGGVISWGFAAYYMVKTLGRFHPDRQWGKFVAFSFFIPWFFTEEGNVYRVKLLRSSGLFVLFIAIGAGIGLTLKALTHQ